MVHLSGLVGRLLDLAGGALRSRSEKKDDLRLGELIEDMRTRKYNLYGPEPQSEDFLWAERMVRRGGLVRVSGGYMIARADELGGGSY